MGASQRSDQTLPGRMVQPGEVPGSLRNTLRCPAGIGDLEDLPLRGFESLMEADRVRRPRKDPGELMRVRLVRTGGQLAGFLNQLGRAWR
jgi:hypothetical protein